MTPHLTMQDAVEDAMDHGWGVVLHPRTLPHRGRPWMGAQPWAWNIRRDCELALALSYAPFSTEVDNLLASGRGGAA